MDFECDFNDLSFCKYSNIGWGFQKSVFHSQKSIVNLPKDSNFFPCTLSNNGAEGSRLEKKVSLNVSQSLCLMFSYLLEEKGKISITNGNYKWSENSSESSSKWNSIRFPLNPQQLRYLPGTFQDSRLLVIAGESVCVDNFTIAPHSCPQTPTTFDNNFSSNTTFLLTQPFNVLLAIIALVILFTMIGLVSSIMFARKTQRTLSRARKLSNKLKQTTNDDFSFQNSLEYGSTINSCCDLRTRQTNHFPHHTRFLPTVLHVRSNPQLVHCSRQSFAASSSVATTDSTPHYRFSLALTEDAQLQLLLNNNGCTSPPVSGLLSARNLSIIRQQSLLTTLSHETSTANENTGNHRSNSILDESESDLQAEALYYGQCNRSRPIRESMNVGYVSDNSLCDLPQYDTAMQLLAGQNNELVQSPDLTEDSDDNNNSDIIENGNI